MSIRSHFQNLDCLLWPGFYDYSQMWSQLCFLPKACYYTYLHKIMFIKMIHCIGRHYAGLVYEESVSNCQTTNALSTFLYEDKCLPKATPGPVDLHLCPVTIEIYICPFNRRHFQMVLSSLGVIGNHKILFLFAVKERQKGPKAHIVVSIKCPGRG